MYNSDLLTFFRGPRRDFEAKHMVCTFSGEGESESEEFIWMGVTMVAVPVFIIVIWCEVNHEGDEEKTTATDVQQNLGHSIVFSIIKTKF